MPSKRKTAEEPWMAPVARAMVREGKTLREAATELAVDMTSAEAENAYRTQVFQKVLRCERNRFYNEIAADPERSKQTAIGMLLIALEKMADAGEYKDVAESVLRLAKIENWLDADTEVTLFANLTGRDIEAVKERLKEKRESTSALLG